GIDADQKARPEWQYYKEQQDLPHRALRARNGIRDRVTDQKAKRGGQRRIAERAEISPQIEVIFRDQPKICQSRVQFEPAHLMGDERCVRWYANRALGEADFDDDQERQQKKYREPKKRHADENQTADPSQSGHCVRTTPSSGGQLTQTGAPRRKKPA